jgi:predicted RNA binding protein YcfA (HicA-like mRNA interferase family)
VFGSHRMVHPPIPSNPSVSATDATEQVRGVWTTNGSTGAASVASTVVFPSLKARQLLVVLTRPPLRYQVVRQAGFHRRLKSAAGYPPLTFAWHDGATIPPGLVRKVLVQQVGLSVQEALLCLKRVR